MKRILLTLTLTLFVGGLSTFAGTENPEQGGNKFKFAQFEATETSWDYTSLIYTITDAAGHEVSVAPSQITYVVRDKASNPISTGKGIFVSINDTRMQSEEDYSITFTATIKKDKISKTIYRKASAKKLILRQQGNSFSYKMMRPKYSSPTDYEKLNIDASNMSVEVAFADCKECNTFKLAGNASHATLTDRDSYAHFENIVNSMMEKGKKVQLMVQPTVNHKDNSVRYAQSYFEVSPNTLKEVEVEAATAAKDGGEE
ncbi:MAG: hypothetical protein JWO03_1893 [Bacteroidetes bacterium]|nr:hypothetical protein [Bacteroidota bacterium]